MAESPFLFIEERSFFVFRLARRGGAGSETVRMDRSVCQSFDFLLAVHSFHFSGWNVYKSGRDRRKEMDAELDVYFHMYREKPTSIHRRGEKI